MRVGIIVILALGTFGCQTPETGPQAVEELGSTRDSLSYSFGIDIANMVQSQKLELDTDTFIQGLRDKLSSEKMLLTDQESTRLIQAFVRERQMEQQASQARQQADMQKAGEGNKAAGEAFLADNGKKEGVSTTASGLQYRVIKAGDGSMPKATDKVSVHYRGTLIDGKEFDSSYGRGEPTEFGVNQVISGWTEGLQLMKTGAKWEFYIPSDLAYGTRGAGGDIGPNATLIFEVELLEIK